MLPRVFVDTNLWYPPSSRAVLLGVGLAGIFEVVTSEGVLDELYRHLQVTEKTNLSPAHALKRVEELKTALLEISPSAVVATDATTPITPIGLPDPDDEHVLAGALAAEADLLLTADDDFPPGLVDATGLDVLTGDELLVEGLQSMQPAWIAAIRYALQFPPKDVATPQELGFALHGAGLEHSGGVLTSASWQSALA